MGHGARVEVSPCPDSLRAGGVVTPGLVIQRQIHEASEGHRAVGTYLFNYQRFERVFRHKKTALPLCLIDT